MNRTLTLRREELAELSADDLSGVVGAACDAITCRLLQCVLDQLTKLVP